MEETGRPRISPLSIFRPTISSAIFSMVVSDGVVSRDLLSVSEDDDLVGCLHYFVKTMADEKD